ncbi:hypothetical protein ACFE04_006262 [Oxalis oulophora]
MTNSNSLKHFLMIFLYMSLILAQVISADINLITSTCQHTPNPNLCISTYKSDPGSFKADLIGLSVIGSKMISKGASSTKATINSLMSSAGKKGDQELIKSLKCSDNHYTYIVKYFVPELMEAVTKGNPKFGQDALRDIGIEADNTPKCFSKSSPIYGQNKFIQDFSPVVKAIVQMLL